VSRTMCASPLSRLRLGLEMLPADPAMRADL
jgi:hypothetical protein